MAPEHHCTDAVSTVNMQQTPVIQAMMRSIMYPHLPLGLPPLPPPRCPQASQRGGTAQPAASCLPLHAQQPRHSPEAAAAAVVAAIEMIILSSGTGGNTPNADKSEAVDWHEHMVL